MGENELQFIAKMVNHVKGVANDVANDVKGLSERVNQGWDKSVAASQKFAAGVAFAGAAAVGFGVASVKAFVESENAIAQLDAVLKSTGGSAGVTREAALDLAKGLQSVTTASDETVLGVENMLLTFTGISKEVFPQATETALDMAQALKMDGTQAAMQLGKALNDPIEGFSRLKRVGVTFTDAQEKQIKTLQESGDVMGAQKVILNELAKEFGGSARAAAGTFSGQLKQLWNIINDGMEVIGGFIAGAIRPLVQGILDFIAKSGGVEGVLKGMADGAGRLKDILPALIGLIAGGLAPAILNLMKDVALFVATNPFMLWLVAGALLGLLINKIVQDFGGWGKAAAALKPVLEGIFSFIGQAIAKLQPLFSALGVLFKAVGEFLAEAFKEAAPVIMAIATVLGPILIAVFGVVVSVFARLFTAVAGLFNALKPFMPVLLAVGAAILLYFIAPWVIAIAIMIAVVIAVTQVVTWIIQLITFLVSAIMPILSGIWAFFSWVWNAILDVVRFVWQAVVVYITTYIAIVRAVIQAGVNAVLAIWNGITRIVGVVAGAIGSVVSIVSNGISNAYNAVAGFIGKFVSVGADIIHGIVRGLESAGSAVKDFVVNIAKGAVDAVKHFFGIGSPSRLMAETVGFPIAQGIAVGIAQGAGLIQDAMNDAIPNPDVAVGASMRVSTDQAGAAQASGSGSGGSAAGAPGGVTTNFYGDVTLQDENAVDRFFDRINRNQNDAAMGAPAK